MKLCGKASASRLDEHQVFEIIAVKTAITRQQPVGVFLRMRSDQKVRNHARGDVAPGSPGKVTLKHFASQERVLARRWNEFDRPVVQEFLDLPGAECRPDLRQDAIADYQYSR